MQHISDLKFWNKVEKHLLVRSTNYGVRREDAQNL